MVGCSRLGCATGRQLAPPVGGELGAGGGAGTTTDHHLGPLDHFSSRRPPEVARTSLAGSRRRAGPIWAPMERGPPVMVGGRVVACLSSCPTESGRRVNQPADCCAASPTRGPPSRSSSSRAAAPIIIMGPASSGSGRLVVDVAKRADESCFSKVHFMSVCTRLRPDCSFHPRLLISSGAPFMRPANTPTPVRASGGSQRGGRVGAD